MTIIKLENVHKHYGEVHALKGINLTVNQGEIYGFIGPNGAGKTTAIRIMLGIIKADQGKTTLLNQDAWFEAVNIHKKVSYVPGDVKLWPNLTGGEVIDILAGFKGETSLEKKAYYLKRFDLDPTKKCRSYSKGNRQKVALVAAFSSEADLYIFDEPTSGLDPLMEQVFQEEVRNLKKHHKTVFLSSHILSEVESLCDHLSIIREGVIIESGSIEALKHLAHNKISVQLEKAFEFKTLDYIKDYALVDNTHTFFMDTDKLSDLFKAIHAYGVKSFENTKPSLESLFMRHYTRDDHA
jgi:ABC-2 type transport system ATP-binding protein